MRLGKFSGEDKGIEFGEEDGNGREDGAVDEIDAIVVGGKAILYGIYSYLFDIGE